MLVHWGGKEFLEAGLEALMRTNDGESSGLEASIGLRSSLDRLDGFKVMAKSELQQSRILDSSLIFQVNPENPEFHLN